MKRLVTRSDFDGLVCAMLLKELDLIDDIKFVHPKDVQDGKIELTENDITTNLPFDPRVGLAFDHHESELTRNAGVDVKDKWVIDGDARSAARVVYRYYGGKDTFKRVSDEIMTAVDKGDSADFTRDEILQKILISLRIRNLNPKPLPRWFSTRCLISAWMAWTRETTRMASM